MEPNRFRIREQNMETLQQMYQNGPTMNGSSSEILHQVRVLIDLSKKIAILFNVSFLMRQEKPFIAHPHLSRSS